MRALLTRFARSPHGTAAMEFAIVVPVMLFMTAAIVEFGLIFHVYNQTNRLATQYAIAWSDCVDAPSTPCGAELSSYTTSSAMTNIAPQLESVNLKLQMFQVKMVGTNPTVTYASPAGSSLTSAQTASAQSAFSNGQSGVIVTADYQHSLTFFPEVMFMYLYAYLHPTYTVTQLKS